MAEPGSEPLLRLSRATLECTKFQVAPVNEILSLPSKILTISHQPSFLNMYIFKLRCWILLCGWNPTLPTDTIMCRWNGRKSKIWWLARTLTTMASGLKQDFNHSAHMFGILMVVLICRAEARRLTFMKWLWNFFSRYRESQDGIVRELVVSENIGSQCILSFHLTPVLAFLRIPSEKRTCRGVRWKSYYHIRAGEISEVMGKTMAPESRRVIVQDLYQDVLYSNKKSSQKGLFQECHVSPWRR